MLAPNNQTGLHYFALIAEVPVVPLSRGGSFEKISTSIMKAFEFQIKVSRN